MLIHHKATVETIPGRPNLHRAACVRRGCYWQSPLTPERGLAEMWLLFHDHYETVEDDIDWQIPATWRARVAVRKDI